MSNELRKFLDQLSGKENDDMINGLDIDQIKVLMALPEFDSNNGLSESVLKVEDALTAKGFRLEDTPVVTLFKRGCLKWVQEGETFTVSQLLCGKENSVAIVNLYVSLIRGGDDSEAFKSFLGKNMP